jgi:hypothetical protein
MEHIKYSTYVVVTSKHGLHQLFWLYENYWVKYYKCRYESSFKQGYKSVYFVIFCI